MPSQTAADPSSEVTRPFRRLHSEHGRGIDAVKGAEVTFNQRPLVAVVTMSTRIISMDVLRGFALLGILLMNVQSFAMVSPAYMNPTAFGDLSGVNYWVWYFSHLFADLKLMSLFSMLFGAGVILSAERIEARGGGPAAAHYRRMGWLLVIGIAHAYLIWHGDILVPYAILGAILYPFRRWKARWLFFAGLLTVSIASVLSIAGQITMPYWPETELEQMAADWSISEADVLERKQILQGPWRGATFATGRRSVCDGDVHLCPVYRLASGRVHVARNGPLQAACIRWPTDDVRLHSDGVGRNAGRVSSYRVWNPFQFECGLGSALFVSLGEPIQLLGKLGGCDRLCRRN